MKTKVKLFITTIILNLFFFEINSDEIKILYKIENEIITSLDVINEINYLSTLNENIASLERDKVTKTAKNSLIREKIKKNEIDRIYSPNYDEVIKEFRVNNFIENLYKKLGYKTIEEFNAYLKTSNLNLIEIKKKFAIELYWNQLIFDKYNKVVNINQNKIKSKLDNVMNNSLSQTEFKLSEIVFINDKENNKYNEILNSINEVGFEETALLHSISESSKFNGDIGWIKENQISDKIFNLIKNLEIGSFSKPIITAGGSIILKLNEKKTSKIEINKDEELKKLIASEKNRILTEYSLIYFKQIENKTYVKEF